MKKWTYLALISVLITFVVGCTTAPSSYQSRHNLGQKSTLDTTGVVARFITTPEGQTDGFILEDGMQVRFPPHMSTAITNAVAIGDTVTIKGYESTTNAIWAEKIITPKNAHEIAMTDEAKGKMVEPRKKRESARRDLTSLHVTGEIDTLLHEPTGEVSGFLLNEGTIVRLPPDIRTPARAYDVGQYVEVTGFGSESKYGKAVEASTVQRDQTEIDYE